MPEAVVRHLRRASIRAQLGPQVDPPPQELHLWPLLCCGEQCQTSTTDEETTTMKPVLGTLALGALVAISSAVIAADAPEHRIL